MSAAPRTTNHDRRSGWILDQKGTPVSFAPGAPASAKLRQLFRKSQSFRFSWASTFGETKDGCLTYPAQKNSRILYSLLRANGTNFAVIAADIIRDLVLKRRNADAGLFAFGR
jgi:hypothetical protein